MALIDAAAVLRAAGHRPWPLPSGRWVMAQAWEDLLFAHWPLPAAALRPLVPLPLDLDEYDGSAWVGQTPFRVNGLRGHGLPAVPGLRTFPELNLRTYVRFGDRPGVFFFALDAGSIAAVLGARATYRLPYFPARMHIVERSGWIHYRSRRRLSEAAFVARYRPVGEPFRPRRGTLEHFLTERYALHAVLRSGAVLTGEIHHPPWTLRRAEAEIEHDTVPTAHGITLPDRAPLLHYSARQDTLIWAPRQTLVTARPAVAGTPA